MKNNREKTRKGICTNFTQCSLADNGVVQEVPLNEDFICSNGDCGCELEEVRSKKKWKPILIAVGVVVLVVIVILLWPEGSKRPVVADKFDTITNKCGDTLIVKNGTDTVSITPTTRIDTIVNARKDTIIVRGCDTLSIRCHKITKVTKRPPVVRETNTAPLYGNYSGPRNEYGEPDGRGGRVTITSEYHWGTRVFAPGDVIENTTYVDGQLKHGRVIKTNGSSFDI